MLIFYIFEKLTTITMKHFIYISLLIFYSNLFSQNFNHEIGVSAGAFSMQSDYKERTSDFVGQYRNVGYTAGLSYYISFDETLRGWREKTQFLKNHFRVKIEANYMQVELSHRGKSIYENTNPIDAKKMRAMIGNTKIYNIGGTLEYLLLDAYYDRKFEPYLAVGIYYTAYDADVKSELGDWKNDSSLIPNQYLTGNGSLKLNPSVTQSFSVGVGSRYNLRNATLVFDFKGQKFLSDDVDGLDPQSGENKNRDWVTIAQLGVVFKIN